MPKPTRASHEVSERGQLPQNKRLDFEGLAKDEYDLTQSLKSSARGSSIQSGLANEIGSSKPLNTLKPYNGHPDTLPPLPQILDHSLTEVVFTHTTAHQGHKNATVNLTYDRLEFLGDAYVEIMASRLIYDRFPHFPVGRLSQQRELLVKNMTLGEYSKAYNFHNRVRTSGDLRYMEPKKVTKLMGDLLEAYTAAIILSDPANGYKRAEEWLWALWGSKLDTLPDVETRAMDTNAKETLARSVMSKGIRLEYGEEAPPVNKKGEGKVWFHMAVYLTGYGWQEQRLGGGTGLSKQEAGTRAAADALGKDLTVQVMNAKRETDMRVKEAREREDMAKVESGNGIKVGKEGIFQKDATDPQSLGADVSEDSEADEDRT